MDVESVATRKRMMAGIRGAHTHPEITVRTGLHRLGFRFRLHSRDLPGRPDLVLAKRRAVIFVHGCFWHRHVGCRYAYVPKSRKKFWTSKFDQNIARDKQQIGRLIVTGWRVLVIWECALRDRASAESSIAKAASWLRSSSRLREVPDPKREE